MVATATLRIGTAPHVVARLSLGSALIGLSVSASSTYSVLRSYSLAQVAKYVLALLQGLVGCGVHEV